ncbi:hypothetical protein Tco_1281908 [Tanacetum coccineum]
MTVRDLTGSGFENTELYSRPKLQRSSNPTRSTNSGSQQSRVPSEGYTHHVCTTCRRRHQESVVVLLVLVSNAARHGQSSAGLQKNTGLSYLWHADNREGDFRFTVMLLRRDIGVCPQCSMGNDAYAHDN